MSIFFPFEYVALNDWSRNKMKNEIEPTEMYNILHNVFIVLLGWYFFQSISFYFLQNNGTWTIKTSSNLCPYCWHQLPIQYQSSQDVLPCWHQQISLNTSFLSSMMMPRLLLTQTQSQATTIKLFYWKTCLILFPTAWVKMTQVCTPTQSIVTNNQTSEKRDSMLWHHIPSKVGICGGWALPSHPLHWKSM